MKATEINNTHIKTLDHIPPEVIELYVGRNRIRDISGIKNYEFIECLDLSNNLVDNIEVLPTLPSLEIVDLRGNPLELIYQYKPLKGMVNLRCLMVDSKYIDLDTLRDFLNIGGLYVCDPKITVKEFVETMQEEISRIKSN